MIKIDNHAINNPINLEKNDKVNILEVINAFYNNKKSYI